MPNLMSLGRVESEISALIRTEITKTDDSDFKYVYELCFHEVLITASNTTYSLVWFRLQDLRITLRLYRKRIQQDL